MKNNIKKVYDEIIDFSKDIGVDKVVLFGSRARGNNLEKSDIDIAVYGCKNFLKLKMKIDEELWSLLHVDIINMDDCNISQELINEIKAIATKELNNCLEKKIIEWYVLKNNIKRAIDRFIYEKTKRRPIVFPMIMEI